MSEERTLVTGFGPFRGVDDNPSAWLAENSGRHYAVLPVTFAAARAFVEEFDETSFDRWVMLGVDGRAERMRLELFARNWVGGDADMDDVRLGPGPIEARGPAVLGSTLWTEDDFDAIAEIEPSTNAGDYLCNYLYFRALIRGRGAIGFLHVPPVTAMAGERMEEALETLLAHVEAR